MEFPPPPLIEPLDYFFYNLAMFETVKYLLMQVRDESDPMREQEVRCFSRALRCSPAQIRTIDLLAGAPGPYDVDSADIVLIGGSGDYSVATGGNWLPPALSAMVSLYESGKPTFASCWGFQAFARALGGRVVTDLSRAEVGTINVKLSNAGRDDPLFSLLGDTFTAQMGHQDIVDELPAGAILLASTDRVENQAFSFHDKPIYATQFHPELDGAALIERVHRYPEYIQRIAGIAPAEFIKACVDTPAAESLLPRFVEMVMQK